MNVINDDKLLIFSDLHVGIKSNSISRLDISEECLNDIIKTIQSHNINTAVFVGDWHHDRSSINVNTMCKSISMIDKLTTYVELYFILGNHDIATNTTTDINSVKYLKDNPRVHVINIATEVDINGRKALMCPWLSDISSYKKETYDYVFGHFDISKKYIINAWAEEHKSENLSTTEIENILIKNGYGFERDIINKKNKKIDKLTNSKKCLGNYVDLCKKGGYIFCGHIHTRRELKVKGRNFIFIGSPLQLNWGDENHNGDTSNRGVYILCTDTDSDDIIFIENNNNPIHKKIYISELNPTTDCTTDELLEDIPIEGNFVKLIYDKQVEFQVLNRLIDCINNMKPIEPVSVDYELKVSFCEIDTDGVVDSESKLMYITNVVNNIGDEIFENYSVKKDDVINMFEKYYEKVER